MHRAALVGFATLLLAGTASARPHHRRARAHRAPSASYFLAGDPHVPLAVVRGGRIGDREIATRRCGSSARWKTIGSRWTALDAWGQPIGTFTATAKDDYDVTGCAELAMAPSLANDLTHVLVSVDSAWRPSASAAWTPPAPKRATLAWIARSTIDDTGVTYVWEQCKSISERTRFFHVPGRGDWAVATSNAGWLVARDDARGWNVRSHDRVKPTRFASRCFRPVAIFDMNGDGVPEIVMRASGGDGWNDFVLALGPDDQWRVVSSSNGGSTA
ncbi:MAG TPA: hypothetical protein VGH28_32660 [Polyangiaceae bacterium]|jgi:hypothetical protein